MIADADSGIPDALRPVLATACDEIEALSDNIEMTERQLEALAEQDAGRAAPPVGPGDRPADRHRARGLPR
jgi:hypothetical protein